MGTANKEVIKGWIWDTGADVHICKDESLMMDIQHTNGCIQQAQGPLIKYNTIGKVTLNVYTSTSIKHVTLSNVVLLCNGNFNLFSPRAAAKASEGDIRCNQQGRDCIMVGKDRQCKQVTWAVKSGNRLYLDVAKSQEDATAFWHMWHCHLRHASLDHIQKSLKAVGIDTHDMPKVFNCEACNAMKFICPSFGSGRNEMKAKLDVVVSDLQGPMPVLSLGGASSQEVAGGNKAGNRITEHVNHTIMNIIQPMLDTAKLPVPLWAKATQHEHEVNIIIDSIQAHFKITRGGDAEWCLGIHIQQNGESVSLAQDAYIDTVLTHFSMNQAVETNTPLDPSAANLLLTDPSHWPLTKEQVVTYQQIMGSVMYLMTSTRPNLAFPISKLASHLASPTTVHLNQAQHLLCYVLHTRSHKLVYS
ncbi:hypothetical protein NDA10_004580 [Ustilago hordei]|nr:hypothetical protein NDA10_004580 [Ustilago hordei]